MHLIRLTAPTEVLRTLHDIAGLELVRTSLFEAADGTWSCSAYATDEAIAEARDRGVRVDVILDAEARRAHLERVAEEARRSRPPGSEA